MKSKFYLSVTVLISALSFLLSIQGSTYAAQVSAETPIPFLGDTSSVNAIIPEEEEDLLLEEGQSFFDETLSNPDSFSTSSAPLSSKKSAQKKIKERKASRKSLKNISDESGSSFNQTPAFVTTAMRNNAYISHSAFPVSKKAVKAAPAGPSLEAQARTALRRIGIRNPGPNLIGVASGLIRANKPVPRNLMRTLNTLNANPPLRYTPQNITALSNALATNQLQTAPRIQAAKDFIAARPASAVPVNAIVALTTGAWAFAAPTPPQIITMHNALHAGIIRNQNHQNAANIILGAQAYPILGSGKPILDARTIAAVHRVALSVPRGPQRAAMLHALSGNIIAPTNNEQVANARRLIQAGIALPMALPANAQANFPRGPAAPGNGSVYDLWQDPTTPGVLTPSNSLTRLHTQVATARAGAIMKNRAERTARDAYNRTLLAAAATVSYANLNILAPTGLNNAQLDALVMRNIPVGHSPVDYIEELEKALRGAAVDEGVSAAAGEGGTIAARDALLLEGERLKQLREHINTQKPRRPRAP